MWSTLGKRRHETKHALCAWKLTHHHQLRLTRMPTTAGTVLRWLGKKVLSTGRFWKHCHGALRGNYISLPFDCLDHSGPPCKEGRGEEGRGTGVIWDAHIRGVSCAELLPSKNSSVQVTCPKMEALSADFWFTLLKGQVHNKGSIGSDNVLIHRGCFCNLKVLNVLRFTTGKQKAGDRNKLS